MREKTLLAISYLTAVIGMIVLLFVLENTQRNYTDNIDDTNDVRIIGKLYSIRHFKNTTYLTLAVERKINLVAYDFINISSGKKIEVLGTRIGDKIVVDELRYR